MGISRAELQKLSFSGKLSEDIALMKEIFGQDETVIFRPFENRRNKEIRGCVIFTELLVNNIVIDQNVVRPLLEFVPSGEEASPTLPEFLANRVICTDDV